MSKHWKEKTDLKKHIDFMSTAHVQGLGMESSPERGEWMYFVRECSFTFQFASLDQLRAMTEYFSHKIHPSTRNADVGFKHFWQLWYERLPKGLTGGSKRERIHTALTKALTAFESEA